MNEHKSPNDLSIEWLRAEGWRADYVEGFRSSKCLIKRDLFGFLDILAIKGGSTIGVQATSIPHMGERVNKILANENAPAWILSRGIWVMGWDWYLDSAGYHYTHKVITLSPTHFKVPSAI